MLTILPMVLHLAALPPMPSDTPPAFPAAVSRLAELRSAQDVVGVTLLANGAPAPAGLTLPTLTNQRHTLEYMRVHYPESMRKVVSTGTAIAWALVNEKGRVDGARLLTTSGHLPLDSLSLAVLRIAEFTPARDGDRAVAVWTPLPARIPPHNEVVAALQSLGNDVSDEPTEIPYTQKPVLLNRTQVEAAIIRTITQLNSLTAEMNEAFARAQRIGGRADMWIFVKTDGSVGNMKFKKKTGNADLDSSARQIAALMRFSPAKNGDTPVDVWIEVPIVFKDR